MFARALKPPDVGTFFPLTRHPYTLLVPMVPLPSLDEITTYLKMLRNSENLNSRMMIMSFMKMAKAGKESLTFGGRSTGTTTK
jgi:hypothetical protein